MNIGDRVEKIKGYRWPGVVVAVFKTVRGETRVVVECIVPAVRGALHIYAPEQLRLRAAPMARERVKSGHLVGQLCMSSKLSEREVLEIRATYQKVKPGQRSGASKLCAHYGITRSTLRNIINRDTWRHI
jgi:hypothetical protein